MVVVAFVVALVVVAVGVVVVVALVVVVVGIVVVVDGLSYVDIFMLLAVVSSPAEYSTTNRKQYIKLDFCQLL